MAEIQLFYLDLRGKAEFIRLVLYASGIKFNDIKVPITSSWTLGPEAKAATPFGQVPYLIYKGKKYGQSLAIATFLAKKLGYYGKTDEDGLRVDEVMQLCEDFRMVYIKNWYRADDEVKAEYAQKMKDEGIPRFLGYFEALLVDNGATGFFVGTSASLADFVIYDILDTMLGVDPEAMKAFPSLQKLRTNVEAIDNLKKYLAERPKSPF